VTERFFDAMLHVYERTLRVSLRYRLAVALVSFLILGATVWLFVRIPKGFLPSEDTGQIFAMTESPQGAAHTEMARDLQTLADRMRQDPSIKAFFAGMGGSSGQGPARISGACSST
jgi:HAE1 family hydrophobic/amphiphilic exporter-1